MEMEMSTNGGLSAMLEKLVATQDMPSIIKIFKDLVLKSYGEKSADGKRFIKNKELVEGFSQTEAFPNLFMELSTDSVLSAAFVNGIVPQAEKQPTSIPEGK